MFAPGESSIPAQGRAFCVAGWTNPNPFPFTSGEDRNPTVARKHMSEAHRSRPAGQLGVTLRPFAVSLIWPRVTADSPRVPAVAPERRRHPHRARLSRPGAGAIRPVSPPATHHDSARSPLPLEDGLPVYVVEIPPVGWWLPILLPGPPLGLFRSPPKQGPTPGGGRAASSGVF